jgi:hypothetical protein
MAEDDVKKQAVDRQVKKTIYQGRRGKCVRLSSKATNLSKGEDLSPFILRATERIRRVASMHPPAPAYMHYLPGLNCIFETLV